ncbi:MAG: MBL fold metallo-hydrolase [Candidatus Gracilibacteria bacterium]
MELFWHGEDTCMINTGKSAQILINPHTSTTSGKKNSVIILNSEDRTKYAKIDADTYVVDWPGEYEVADCLITGVEIREEDLLLKTAYNIHLPEDISIAVVGDVSKVLGGEEIELLGSADILVLSLKNLDPKDAHKIVDHVEPHFVVPVDYKDEETLENFLKTLGVTQLPEKKSSLKLSKSDIPEIGITAVVLDQQK